jgi:glycosyltransferase involved in cell wall biosynthesis
MRIGIVTVSFLPRLGGAVTQTLLLHHHLRQRGHHVEVFCPDLKKEGQYTEEGILVNRVTHPRVRGFEDHFSRLLLLARLRQAIQRRRRDFDVFITPEFNIGPLSLCLTRGIRKVGIYGADLTFETLNVKRRQIISYPQVLDHKVRPLGLKNYLLIALLNGLQYFMFKRLDHVIVLNQEDERRIRRHADDVSLISCLVANQPAQAAVAQKPRERPQMATIIGRAVSWKKISESIEVALDLEKGYPGLQIHYFGTGPEMPAIESQYGDRIGIHKQLRNTQILEWLGQSDITINMSEYETFCIANTEAMINRSLLVVKPLAEYRHYLQDQHNCLTLERPGSPESIAKVQAAFATRRVKAILDAAQQTVAEQMDLEKTVNQIESLLDRIVRGSPVGSGKSAIPDP